VAIGTAVRNGRFRQTDRGTGVCREPDHPAAEPGRRVSKADGTFPLASLQDGLYVAL